MKDEDKLPAFKQLIKFVRKAMKDGHTRSNVIKVLSKEGWPKKQIELAIEEVQKGSTKKLFGFIPLKNLTEDEKLTDDMKKRMKQNRENKEKIQEDMEKLYDLKRKEEDFLDLKNEFKEEVPKILTEDVKRVLKNTDELLTDLPEEKVEQFVKSQNFKQYKKVMKKVHEPLKDDKKAIKKLDKVITLFEKGAVTKEEARQLLGLEKFDPKKVEKLDKKKILDKIKDTKKYEN
jgi:hypothetical protein